MPKSLQIKNNSTLFTLVSFLVIVVLSASFRITNTHIIEFKADEAINLFLASRPLFGHSFPPGGTASSVGILNPPLFNYLLFPFLLLTKDPKTISFFIGLINAISIGFFYIFIKRYYGFLTAGITTLLFAFSPWAIIFSRKIWSQDMVLPFLILVLYSLHKIILENKISYWIPCIASSLFLIQLHQSSILFLLLLALFLLHQKMNINIGYIILGFVIGIIPAIPYILYEIQNGCLDCKAILDIRERLSYHHATQIFLRPIQILSQGNFSFVLGSDTLTFAQKFPIFYNLRTFFYIEYLFIPLSMLLFWKNNKKTRFLVYTTIALPTLYFALRFEPFMHYFIPLMPILFLFLGFLLSRGFTSKKSFVSKIFSLIFLTLVLTSISFNYAFFQIVKSQKTIKGDYGSSYAVTEELAKKRFASYKHKKDYEEILLTSFVPKHLIHGNLPVARMIYDYTKTERNLSFLDKKLHENPDDPRIQNELIAYYTHVSPTRSSISDLRNKYKRFPEYGIIYEQVYAFYLVENFKKSHHSGLGFSIEYPQHWQLQENIEKKLLIIKNSPYILSIQAVLSKYQMKKTTCITKEKTWCGTTYESFQLKNGNIIEIRYTAQHFTNLAISNKELVDAIKIMDQIVESLRDD